MIAPSALTMPPAAAARAEGEVLPALDAATGGDFSALLQALSQLGGSVQPMAEPEPEPLQDDGDATAAALAAVLAAPQATLPPLPPASPALDSARVASLAPAWPGEAPLAPRARAVPLAPPDGDYLALPRFVAAPAAALGAMPLPAARAEPAVVRPAGSMTLPLPPLPPLPGMAGEGGLPAAPAGAALPEWAGVKLPADKPAQWADPLRAALAERLTVQSSHGIDRALIRLDPPHLGSLEIAIRHEAGGIQVQLVASSSELVRQLHAISDALRQDLGNRQYAQVSVDVREGAPGGHGQGQGRQPGEGARDGKTPGQALAEAQAGESGRFGLDEG